MPDGTRPPHDPDDAPEDNPTDTPDVNEAVVEEWVAETTAFDRVYEVIHRTYDPESAATLADRARVSETTARKHLRTLVDAGEVATTEEDGTTRYCRSEIAMVTEHARSLLEDLTHEEIATGIADMKAQIGAWREEYGVDSPEAFARELDIEDADSEHAEVLSEWQTTRRNLALAEAALAIGEASETGHLSGGTTEDADDNDTSLVV
jgi:DNA-binding MarR family transcriptional regulator